MKTHLPTLCSSILSETNVIFSLKLVFARFITPRSWKHCHCDISTIGSAICCEASNNFTQKVRWAPSASPSLSYSATNLCSWKGPSSHLQNGCTQLLRLILSSIPRVRSFKFQVNASVISVMYFVIILRSDLLPWNKCTLVIPQKKYVNIPSGKYIYVHKYVYICVYTYLCKMDEYRYNAGLSWKWMSTSIMLACHKNGWVPVWCWLVIKMDERRSYASLS